MSHATPSATPSPEPRSEPSPHADPLRVWFRFIRLNRRVTAAIGAELRRLGLRVEQGRFGADMQVELVNDGPVTIWLDTAELRS